MVLVVFFFACAETFFLVRDRMLLERIVRDGAREAAITGDMGKGEEKADDRARQFFGDRASEVTVTLDRKERNGAEVVVCTADYTHPVFGSLSLGVGEVRLSARAVFSWKDT